MTTKDEILLRQIVLGKRTVTMKIGVLCGVEKRNSSYNLPSYQIFSLLHILYIYIRPLRKVFLVVFAYQFN